MDIDSLYTLYLQHPEICTDTRKIAPGCIFVALKGLNFDGNSFASQALHQGAAYAIISDTSISGPKFIHVDDTLIALQSLANHHRRHLDIPIIAITGSNGKTTTKELTACALSEKYRVHATIGNLNNHIGVPLTLLGAPTGTEIIICEMGANHPGEIKKLCEIAMPTHGLITNIGKAHLEGFGSIEGVQKAKGELFDYLKKNDGHAFVNVDDPRLKALADALPVKTTYGFNHVASPDIYFSYVPNPDQLGFTIQDLRGETSIHSVMFGDYNASNVLAAYTVAQHFKVSNQKISDSLSHFIPGANRSETILFKGCRIIKDAYNANPTSMELALRSFAKSFPDGWIILGDMKELGTESISAHEHIINVISELHFKHVVLVGTTFHESLKNQKGLIPNVVTGDQIENIKTNWDWKKCEGRTLLLKGSRSMYLERLLEP